MAAYRRARGSTRPASSFHAGISSRTDVEDVEQHRLDDEAVVVVPVKGRPVAVDAVALVPLVVLPQRVVDAHPIPRGAETRQRGLDRGREQQPIAEHRRNRAARLERRNELLRRRRTQRLSERPRRPQNPLGQESRVDQRLPLACEVQEVRRRRVDRAGDGAASEVGVFGALTTLGRLVGGELDPRRDARHQPSKRLEVAHRPPVGLRRLLDRHPRLQRTVREVFQDRIREARHHADPVRAVALCRGGWLPCQIPGTHQGRHAHRPRRRQKVASIHGRRRYRTNWRFGGQGGSVVGSQAQ